MSRFRSSHDFRLLFSDFDCSEAEALDGAEDVIGGFGPFEGFGVLVWAMSLSLLKFVGQASLVDDAMLPS